MKRNTFAAIAALLAVLAGPLLAPGAAITPQAAVTAAPRELAHRPPVLTSPTTITLGPTMAVPTLDPAKDYILKLPDVPYTRNVSNRSLVINGGDDVVVVGGEIRTSAQRAVYTVNTRGTLYIEGLLVSGTGTQDAFAIDSRYGGTVVIQNVYVDEIHGTQDGYHADLIQTWAGPGRLLVDHFYGRSDYQGFYLVPNDQWPGWNGTEVDLRHVHLDLSEGNYALWAVPSFPVFTHEVWVTPNPAKPTRDWLLWPKGDARWAGVRLGTPFPPVDRDTVGVGYRSIWE